MFMLSAASCAIWLVKELSKILFDCDMDPVLLWLVSNCVCYKFDVLVSFLSSAAKVFVY